MNTSGEAADQVVRMSLEVGEAALKISGEGAKQLAVLLYAVLQDQSKGIAKSKGKTRLETLVRTGKPLKVFSVKESDLKKFAKEAKRYGILYCAIRNPKENTDGMVDIMVKEEDAPRINRIVERFKLSAVEEKAIVETETETEVDKTEEKAEAEKVLFFKLNTSYLSNYIQIKIRYDPNHSDAFCFRLFKAVPFSVIMISVTFSHKKQEPPRLKFGACFACTVDSTLQKSCFTHIYEKLLHTHL